MKDCAMKFGSKQFRRGGQVALITVFLIGSFILLIALTLAFLSISSIASSQAVRSADQALSVASAGIQDGVLRLIRDNSFSGNYTVDVNGQVAQVGVVNTSLTNSRAVITVSSTVGSSQRTLQATVSVVSSTGQVSIISWQQI